MKFEEILPLLRKDKKARCLSFDTNGEYWQAGYSGLKDILDDNGEVIHSPRFLTIHRLNKDGLALNGKYDWGIPCWAIMAEDWEIVSEPTP